MSGKTLNGLQSIQCRNGRKFYEEVEKIKDKRLRNGKSKDRVSTEKVTNLIVSHKGWEGIAADIIEISEEEANKHGGN